MVGIGTLAGYAGGPLLTAAAALAIAVLFQPLRHRAKLLANRIVYGQRATPYQVLSDFAQDMAGQLDADAALDRMSSVPHASRATVALSCPDSHLEFSVTDDDAGFEPADITHGTGLQGMADRLAAVGGILRVLSQPGHGTIVSGTLPVPPVTERRR